MSLLEGTVVGGVYRLEDRVGTGAFAWVYRASQLFRGESIATVAVKIFTHNPDLAEVRKVARLCHSSLIAYRNIVEDQGHIFLVMEYADGGTADAMLRIPSRVPGEEPVPGPWSQGGPEAKVRQIVQSAAEALAYLAQLDPPVVHRDVKPANMLSVGSKWKLGDLGLAKELTFGAQHRNSGAGSAPYSAPEQHEENGRVSPASDVFSLAVMAYELLTGSLPFDGLTDLALYSAKLAGITPDRLHKKLLEHMKGQAWDAQPTLGDDGSDRLAEAWVEWMAPCLDPDPARRWSAARVAEHLRTLDHRELEKRIALLAHKHQQTLDANAALRAQIDRMTRYGAPSRELRSEREHTLDEGWEITRSPAALRLAPVLMILGAAVAAGGAFGVATTLAKGDPTIVVEQLPIASATASPAPAPPPAIAAPSPAPPAPASVPPRHAAPAPAWAVETSCPVPGAGAVRCRIEPEGVRFLDVVSSGELAVVGSEQARLVWEPETLVMSCAGNAVRTPTDLDQCLRAANAADQTPRLRLATPGHAPQDYDLELALK